MGRKLMAIVALAAAASLAATAIAAPLPSTTMQVGKVIFTLGGGTKPKKLSKGRWTPVKTTIFGKIKASDGGHPPALREVVVDIDKDVKVDVKGYPICKKSDLAAQNTAAARRACGKATLGAGIAHAEIAFPEQPPLPVTSPITIFNGGGNARKTKLLIHTFLTVPVPASIVTETVIQKRGTGIHTISKIPRIAGGSGSALDFRFTLGKTYRFKGKKHYYSSAKCPDGKFIVRARKVLFKNEARDPSYPPQTVVKGAFATPCTPTR